MAAIVSLSPPSEAARRHASRAGLLGRLQDGESGGHRFLRRDAGADDVADEPDELVAGQPADAVQRGIDPGGHVGPCHPGAMVAPRTRG